MGEIIVTTKLVLESGYTAHVMYEAGDSAGDIVLKQRTEEYYTREEALQLAELLVAYARGFEFPPPVGEDHHVAFPDKAKHE